MTEKQLEDANALVERIDHLQKILNHFKASASSFDESLRRMTGYYIVNDNNGFGFRENINQGELLFLIEALEKEINMLKMEFGKI